MKNNCILHETIIAEEKVVLRAVNDVRTLFSVVLINKICNIAGMVDQHCPGKTSAQYESEVQMAGAKEREKLFELHRESLEELAATALQRRLLSNQFTIALVDTSDDPTLKTFIDYLVPNPDWQQHEDREEGLLGRAIMAFCNYYLAEFFPDIAPALENPIPPGLVRAVVLGSKGASTYLLKPSFSLTNQ